MHRWLTISAAVCLASCASPAQQPPCSLAESIRAEEESDRLRSWDDLYRSYGLYGRCNDVSAAEGYSESVVRILADHWETLPQLAKLASNKGGFRDFVIDGVNATVYGKDLKKIVAKSKSACPPGLHQLCKDLEIRAKAAIEEQASYRPKK